MFMEHRSIWSKGWRGALLIGVGIVMAANLLTPAIAHVTSSVAHLFTHTDTRYYKKAPLRFINLQPYGANIRNGATFASGFGPNAGIILPDASTPAFEFGITLPPTYRTGTPLTLRVVWHTSDTSCGIELAPNFTAVARPGRTHIIGPTASTGLTAVGGNTLNAPATTNQSSAKSYTLNTPVAGTPLRAGDTYIFGVFRSSAAGSDTCTSSLVVQGASIKY
jgi:hypothetical protein